MFCPYFVNQKPLCIKWLSLMSLFLLISFCKKIKNKKIKYIKRYSVKSRTTGTNSIISTFALGKKSDNIRKKQGQLKKEAKNNERHFISTLSMVVPPTHFIVWSLADSQPDLGNRRCAFLKTRRK